MLWGEGSYSCKQGTQGVSHREGDKYKDLKAAVLEQAVWSSRRTVQAEGRT